MIFSSEFPSLARAVNKFIVNEEAGLTLLV